METETGISDRAMLTARDGASCVAAARSRGARVFCWQRECRLLLRVRPRSRRPCRVKPWPPQGAPTRRQTPPRPDRGRGMGPACVQPPGPAPWHAAALAAGRLLPGAPRYTVLYRDHFYSYAHHTDHSWHGIAPADSCQHTHVTLPDGPGLLWSARGPNPRHGLRRRAVHRKRPLYECCVRRGAPAVHARLHAAMCVRRWSAAQSCSLGMCSL